MNARIGIAVAVLSPRLIELEEKIIRIVLASLMFVATTAYADEWISGYWGSDGSYVMGHWRSKENQATPTAPVAASTSAQDECRVVPRTPYDDPKFLHQMATISFQYGQSKGMEFLQQAARAQREIDLEERACAACANAGLPNGSLERSNCVADQVAKNRRPESAASPSLQPKRSVTCRKNALDGSVTCTED